MKTIRIGSRGSLLALTQTNWVKERLKEANPDCHFEIVKIKTRGDQILDRSLAKVGGKGLFIKEIEQALLDGQIDLAVHSLKDMPARVPEGLKIGAITNREDPRDVLITKTGVTLSELPLKARIGTSSLRRKALLLAYRQDLIIVPIRGNIHTRLRKLEEENLDGIILAAAGLNRMGWRDRVSQYLDPDFFIPAVGQGALAIEIREDDTYISQLVAGLDHSETRAAVTAERGLLERLEGSCQIPVGAYGRCQGQIVTLTGFVADLTGSRVIRRTKQSLKGDAHKLGIELAEIILAEGGTELLTEIKQELKKK
ncbi:hydroxymethylbilane synthase [Anoxybacter fermentans]|uniref:Porphobilinogen deaminase n=1 Tax=Anoxybacter fermentans TaxID=1323375 RepID=A0A3Q9HQN5_9FIRM|nr:hydroxymethylbilane synthase [Anoxybacter fermentans]AZR73293.1 hydroxymethylbilane synthase [Anoxybacter fermentans]